MKRKICILLCGAYCYVLPITGLTTIVLVTASCTNTQKNIAYKTLKTTADSVASSMRIFAQLNKQGKISAEQYANVRSKYNSYQIAMLQAIDVARFNYKSPTPESVTALAESLINTVITLTK